MREHESRLGDLPTIVELGRGYKGLSGCLIGRYCWPGTSGGRSPGWPAHEYDDRHQLLSLHHSIHRGFPHAGLIPGHRPRCRGVGFLGAGALLQTKKHIRGLTTAATIWLVAAIGMAVGTGAYFIAIFTTALSTVLLALLAPVSERLERRAEKRWKTHPRDS